MSPRIFGIIVTFRRPDDVRTTIASIREQTLTPDVLIVVDNDPTDELAQDVVLGGAIYVPMPCNAGPAGGIAAGMTRALTHATDADLLMLIDDDNPPEDRDLVERLVGHLLSLDASVAGVGAMGARYDRRLGRLVRLSDEELTGGPIDVDYLGGNQLPVYRIGAVREVGTFDPELFFGYEELEYGLRLRERGRRLVVPGDVALELRLRYARLGVSPSANRVTARASWRVYYGARNMIQISKRHAWAGAVALNLLHHGIARPIRLLAKGTRNEAILSLRGAVDGLLGRMGRRIDP